MEAACIDTEGKKGRTYVIYKHNVLSLVSHAWEETAD